MEDQEAPPIPPRSRSAVRPQLNIEALSRPSTATSNRRPSPPQSAAFASPYDFPLPPVPNMAPQYARPSTAGSSRSRRPSPPQSTTITNPARFAMPMPPSPISPRFPNPHWNPTPSNQQSNSRPARYPTPPTPTSGQRPSPPQSGSSASAGRFPTPPSPHLARFPMPPQPYQNRRPSPPEQSYSSGPTRYPTPPSHNPSRRLLPPQSSSTPSSPRYPPPQNSLRPAFQNTRSATMPNMPSRPPATLTPEQQSIAKRLRGSYLGHEEDAVKAEIEAKRNYAKLEDEMVMARKFRRDNAHEKKKLEVLVAEVREKLGQLRGQWESARAAKEGLRGREDEMAMLRQDDPDLSREAKDMKRAVLEDHDRQVVLARERWQSVNAVKDKLMEEDKAVKDKDGRRQKRFNEGIEGHDKRRHAMRTRLARACHYAIYHAQRASDYRIERERLIADPGFREARAILDGTMKRAEGYLKGPVDEDSGERFWSLHASKSWWTKMPEGKLGTPPSP